MYHYCKLCGECLLLEHTLGNMPSWNSFSYSKIYKCLSCIEYCLCIKQENNNILYESIQYKNWCISFWPQNKMAYLRKDRNGTFHFYPLDEKELSHELAAQWLKKLKIYVIIQ